MTYVLSKSSKEDAKKIEIVISKIQAVLLT